MEVRPTGSGVCVGHWSCLEQDCSVQPRALCHAYSLDPKAFKAVVSFLEKQCNGIADQIQSYIRERRSHDQASMLSRPDRTSEVTPTSPSKSPVKSAMKLRTTTRKVSTPVTTPSRKRAVAFTSLEGNGANDDTTPFPETPTKKRRVSASSPDKSRASHSPTKRASVDSTAAFRAALRSSPAKHPAAQASGSPSAGPSTPRRLRYTKAADTATVVQANTQSSPSRSQDAATPTRPLVRHRFRPIFLEQQQWCARDLKVEQMWATAETVLEGMVALHGHPFQQVSRRGGVVVGAA